MIFTIWQQPLDLVGYNQWHKRKKPYIWCYLSRITSSWFCNLIKFRSAFVSAFNEQVSSKKSLSYEKVKNQALTMKKTENVGHYAVKVQQRNDNGWCDESAATTDFMCFAVFNRRSQKSWKTILLNGKSNRLPL